MYGFRVLIAVFLTATLFSPPVFSGTKEENDARKAEFEAGKACGEQCGTKFGVDKKDYDRGKYEECVTLCMDERRNTNAPVRKKR